MVSRRFRRCRDHFQAPGHRQRRALLRPERLEERLAPAVDFAQLHDAVNGYLNLLGGSLTARVNAAQATLPIINTPLSGLTGAKDVISTFETPLLTVLGNLESTSGDANIAAALDAALGPNGANVEGSNPQVMSVVHQKTDADPVGTPAIDIKLHLTKFLGETQAQFGLGLDSMPFATAALAKADLSYTMDLEFGLLDDATNTFFVTPDQLHLWATAGLADPATNPTCVMGFLEGPAVPNGLIGFGGLNGLDFAFDYSNDPSIPGFPMLAPKLSGNAAVNFHFTGEFPGAQLSPPTTETDLVMKWQFNASQANHSGADFGSEVDFAFKNVRIGLGSYFTNMLGPMVEYVQKYTAPYKDFFALLGSDVPVVGDLAKAVGMDGFSWLDLAGIVADSGKVPPDYAAIIDISKDIIQFTNVINAIELDPSLQNAWLDIGDFDIVANQAEAGASDIRSVISAATSGFKDVSANDWSGVAEFVHNLPVDTLKDQITAKLDAQQAQALNTALDTLKQGVDGILDNAAKVDLTFPVTDSPKKCIFDLLIGRNTVLVDFRARANLHADSDLPVFNYDGFEIGLEGQLGLDAELHMAYDTYGLREILSEQFSGQPEDLTKLTDGLFLDPASKLELQAGIAIKGGVNLTLLQAYAVGDLTANFQIHATPVGEQGKIRPFNFTSNLFDVSASLTGGLSLDFKEGVDPLVFEQKVDIAQGTLATFDQGGVNPFDIPPNVELASQPTDPNNAVMTLYLGANAGLRNYQPNASHENFYITHSDYRPGDKNWGEAYLVSAFGFTKRYSGVSKIVAIGAGANVTVTIDPSVTADINLTGGALDNTFLAQGTGQVYLQGGGGHNILTAGSNYAQIHGGTGTAVITAGSGDADLYGADGGSEIHGGSGTNHIFGGKGNDKLYGGTGTNFITGGLGDDLLVAGPQDDILTGGQGNNTFLAGMGHSKFIGGPRENDYVWNSADFSQVILHGDGPTDITGAGTKNVVHVYGGPEGDTFSVSKLAGNPNFDVQILAPSDDGPGTSVPVRLHNVDYINIEGAAGPNNITVNDLTGTRVKQVGVDLDKLVKDHFDNDDGTVDHIVINGTPQADTVTVRAELQTIQLPDNTEDQGLLGGVTTFSGLPHYKVMVANINDDVTFNARGGADTINVLGITGPTLINGNGEDDVFNVTAMTPADYATGVTIDAGGGANALHVSEPTAEADSFVVTQNQISSNLLHTVAYKATAGNFTKGVSLATTDDNDSVQVQSTLPNVATTVTTGAGDDIVRVGSPGLDGVLDGIAGPLNVDLQSGLGNILFLKDAAAVTGNQYVAITANSVAGFAGPTDNVTIGYNANGGSMTLALSGSKSASIAEHYVVYKPNASLLLNAKAGVEQVDILGLSRPATVYTGPGQNSITASPLFKDLGLLQGSLTVHGPGTLSVYDNNAPAQETYTVTAGSVSRTGSAGINFDPTLSQLLLAAGAFNDQVVVQTAPAAPTYLFGGNGSNTLTGPNQDTLWNINQQNAGSLGDHVFFTQFQNLSGGTGNDHFVIQNGQGVTGSIKGGTGSNVLDFSHYTTPVVVDLGLQKATNVGGINNLQTVVGGSASDTFVGPNSPNFWSIGGFNSGSVNTMQFGVYTFSSIENLKGGSSLDTFAFNTAANLTGKIDGAGGTNALNYGNYGSNVYVNLKTGRATATNGIANIKNVTGSSSNNLLVGNGGNTLTGGNGRNILIAGGAASTLIGGNGEDILIGGTTNYDATDAALLAIFAEWNRTNENYTIRVSKLMTGNGVPLLNATTVTGNGGGNTMLGKSAVDLFFGKANVDTNDWVGNQAIERFVNT